MKNCIFCAIANKEQEAGLLYEDDDVVAFSDINPIAPVHVLVVPKKHIPTIADLADEETELVGKLIMTAKRIAEEKGIAEEGYKLLFRVKHYGGQEVDHIHLHLLGGARLSENIHPI